MKNMPIRPQPFKSHSVHVGWTNVNSYTERDRALMENAVRRYFNDE